MATATVFDRAKGNNTAVQSEAAFISCTLVLMPLICLGALFDVTLVLISFSMTLET